MKPIYKRSKDSQVIFTQLMLPSHSNFSGKIHGGHLLNLMDQVAFACASKHSGHYCVTASVNKVDFLTPIEVGELVTLKASVNYTGKSSMVVGLRVEAENIQSGHVRHSNSSYFTMIAKDENGKKATVPGLIIESIEDVRRFTRSIRSLFLYSDRPTASQMSVSTPGVLRSSILWILICLISLPVPSSFRPPALLNSAPLLNPKFTCLPYTATWQNASLRTSDLEYAIAKAL